MTDKLQAIVVDLGVPAIKKLALPEYKVDAFDLAMLPDVLRDYVSDSAERLQTSPDFVAVGCVCMLSGVIGARVRIQPKRNNPRWQASANLWGALIGAPSSMKSPSLSEALRPLRAFECETREGFEGDLRQFKTDKKLFDIRVSQAEQQASKAAKNGDDKKAFAELAFVADGEPLEPSEPRIIVNDSTVPKLGELLNLNKGGLLLVRDELSGWLAEMQNENRGGDRAFYLESYNGIGGFSYDRIGRGTVRIENCCLAMIGGVQPSKIAPIVADAMQGRGDDGLLQRFQLITWPAARPYPAYSDPVFNDAALKQLESIVSELARIDPETPRLMMFDDQAQQVFIEWRNDLAAVMNAEKSELFKAFLTKQEKTAFILAAIFALVSDPNTSSIDLNSMIRAAQWCEYLRSHARKLYRLNDGAAIYAAMLIAKRWQDLPSPFSVRDVYRKHWRNLGTKEEAEPAVKALLDHGYLIEQEPKQTEQGGRPAELYCFNPKLEERHFDFGADSHA